LENELKEVVKMKFKQYLIYESTYNRWVRFTPESLKLDWREYKKKEDSKWRQRAILLKSRWPLFSDFDHFKEDLDNAEIVKFNEFLLNRVQHATNLRTLDDLRDMVSTYIKPRDIDRIVDGFNKGHKIPLPIILKSNNKYFIMAGNTRQNVARKMGITPKALIIKVEEI
jgi:hypothetical protein